jgi:hypothetical protein
MPLIDCPDCGKQVSTSAEACPNCGFPVAARLGETAPAESSGPSLADESEEPLIEARPSWWQFFWHLVFFWLIVPWVVAWWRRASVVLRVYPGRIMLERGVFSKCYREFLVRDIRAIDIDQSFMGRLLGVGDLTISTSATVDAAESIQGIPHPQAIRDLILAQRGKAG